MTSTFVSLCPASFCTPRPNWPVTPSISWLPTFSFQSPMVKRTSEVLGHLYYPYSELFFGLIAHLHLTYFSSRILSCSLLWNIFLCCLILSNFVCLLSHSRPHCSSSCFWCLPSGRWVWSKRLVPASWWEGFMPAQWWMELGLIPLALSRGVFIGVCVSSGGL